MKSSRVITNFDHESDDGINTTALGIIGGCTDNKDYEFTKSELINLVTYQTDYAKYLGLKPTAGVVETGLKNQSKAKLANGMHIICTEINVQQGGNTTALQGSGAPLTLDSLQQKSGITTAPDGLKVEAGVEITELDAKVKRDPGLHDHGTMFAIKEAANTEEDINLWTMKYCTCHHLTITGLKAGTKYMVAAAHQGPSGTKLVWCKPISVWTKLGN